MAADRSDGSLCRMAEEMMLNFQASGHPTFRAPNAFERGELQCKGGGACQITNAKTYIFSDSLLCVEKSER